MADKCQVCLHPTSSVSSAHGKFIVVNVGQVETSGRDPGKIEAVTADLEAVLGQPQSEPAPEAGKTRKKYKLSAEGRAKKVAAIKARWKKAGKNEGKLRTESVKTRKKNKFSAAGLARIKAAQKARWAKFNAAKVGETEAKTETKGGLG